MSHTSIYYFPSAVISASLGHCCSPICIGDDVMKPIHSTANKYSQSQLITAVGMVHVQSTMSCTNRTAMSKQLGTMWPLPALEIQVQNWSKQDQHVVLVPTGPINREQERGILEHLHTTMKNVLTFSPSCCMTTPIPMRPALSGIGSSSPQWKLLDHPYRAGS
jgi:hypothetical protein